MQLHRRHYLLLCAFTALTVLPQLALRGTNIVTRTYALAALRLWHGISPYAAGPDVDMYKYAPMFGVLYLPFAVLPPGWQASLWALLNIAVFWAGILRWVSLSRPPRVLWVALVLAMMELDGSLRYQQTNALLVGVTLWALAEYRDGRWIAAGFWLGLAADWKILPALFVILLPWRLPFVGGLALAALTSLVVPLVIVGPAKTLAFHLDWFRIILGDTGGAGLHDLQSALAQYGYAKLGFDLRMAVLGLSVLLMAAISWRGLLYEAWELWIAIAWECLLLASPRTESPTFVLVSPCYLLVALALARGRRSISAWFVYALSAFLISISFNDIWPKALWDPRGHQGATKTLGLFAFWLLTGALLSRREVLLRSLVTFRKSLAISKR